jgi:4-aminobutyrate aminotransferase-like enzyme
MVAMELVKNRMTKEPLPAVEVMESLMDEGLLAYLGGYHRNVVAFLPPLICVKQDIDEAVNILKSVFSNIKA